MSWRDQLRPARLGSASFEVETAEAQLGRNTQVHEYPLRNVPYVEDLGRRARRFTFEAYVLSPRASSDANVDNYMPARDALIAELEAPGSKTLVHPYLGEMRVVVVEAAGPRESTREGGMARFTITVVEAGELRFPAATSDTRQTTLVKADLTVAAAETEFSERFEAGQLPAFIPAHAAELVRGLATRLGEIARTVTTVPGEISSFVNDLSSLSGAATQLVLAPLTLARNVASIVSRLRMIAAGPPEALRLVRQLFRYGSAADVTNGSVPVLPVALTGTPARQSQAENQAAFVSLVQQLALIEAARVTSTMQFVSFEDAIRVRDELVAEIDTQCESASNGSNSDVVYYALVELRTAVVNDIQVRGADLARVVRMTLNEATPALALAYRLYGDSNRDEDVTARNNVRNPLFVPGGAEIEVLSDG